MWRFAAEIATDPPGSGAFPQVTISGFGSHGSHPPNDGWHRVRNRTNGRTATTNGKPSERTALQRDR